MTETIKLPGEWGLRKLSLADETQWAIQYMGMDWMRIYVREFLPTPGSGTAIDEEIRKFAAAMNAAGGALGGVMATTTKCETCGGSGWITQIGPNGPERLLCPDLTRSHRNPTTVVNPSFSQPA